MTDLDRREQLIAAALAGELSPQDAAEFARLRATDPSIDVELAELGEIVSRLSTLPEWQDVQPSVGLDERVAAILGGAAPAAASAVTADVREIRPGAAEPPAASASARFRRYGWVTALAAAACFALGAGGMAVFGAITSLPPTGPPGTLGALEAISFEGEPSGVRVEGSLVAHTWGTETFLEIDGLPVGVDYVVVLVDAAGQSIDSGSFIGATATVDCRMNAAIMREEVASVQIQDFDGSIVATAALPPVG